MTKFVPNKEHLRTALIFCFHLKKTTESYRLLGEAYGEHRKKRVNDGFKIGDFDVADKENRLKRIEDVELQALLNKDDSQTQKHM